jgi:hypothetical protein
VPLLKFDPLFNASLKVVKRPSAPKETAYRALMQLTKGLPLDHSPSDITAFRLTIFEAILLGRLKRSQPPLKVVFDDDLSGSDNEDREDLPFKRSDFSDDEDVTPDVVELTGCTTPTELEPDLRRATTEVDTAIALIHDAHPNLYSEPFHLLLCIISSIAESAAKIVNKIGVNSREWILLSSLQGSMALLYVLGFVWDSASWSLTLGPKPVLEIFKYAKGRLYPSVRIPEKAVDTLTPIAPACLMAGEGGEVTNVLPTCEPAGKRFNGFMEHCCDPTKSNDNATESLWNLRTLNELVATREWSAAVWFANTTWSEKVAGDQLALLAKALKGIMETNEELLGAKGFLADSLVTLMGKACDVNTLRLQESNKYMTNGISLRRLNHLITEAMESATLEKDGDASTCGDATGDLIGEELQPNKGNDSPDPLAESTNRKGFEPSLPPIKSGIKDETWQTLVLWRHLADKQEEFVGCSQEWVWESRRWSPLFLKKHEELNKWCKDNYGLEEDGSVDKLALQFPSTAPSELRMFHALWVWAGFEEWSKLPLIVENFVRLLGEIDTDCGIVSDDGCSSAWYDAPETFHADQIKLLPLYLKLGARKHLSVGLTVGGHLLQHTAEMVSQLVCDDAEQTLTPSLQDYTNSYLSLLRNKRSLASYNSVELPFPASSAWTQRGALAHSWVDIMGDRVRLLEWVKGRSSGRPNDIWLAWMNDRNNRQSRAERIVTWGLHTWELNHGTQRIPLIIRELLLKAAHCKQAQPCSPVELAAYLRLWGGLGNGYHNDQLNLCKMYNNQNSCYMIGGLQAGSLLTETMASAICLHITAERVTGELLVSAYSRIHEVNKPRIDIKALRKQRKLKKKLKIDSDTDETGPVDNKGLCGSKNETLNKTTTKPLKCHIDYAKVKDSWGGLVTDTQFYEAARKNWAGITEWCRHEWLTPYLPWERLMEFKDEKLTERHRLIFWLCQLWERVETHPGDTTPEIPYIYDELLKRYVRDYNKPERWGVEGTQAEAVAKWRKLEPGYHEDQIALCGFYASVDVSLAIKGLETGGFLTPGEAAYVVSALWDGARYCESGVMTGEYLRGFYTALREGRADVSCSKTVYFRRLRLEKLLEKRAGAKKSLRRKNSVYDDLNEEREVRKLKEGTKTRSVAADCKGLCGIALSTIKSSGDGVYALSKKIKKGFRLMKYEGHVLRSKAEVLEASRTSNYVMEFGDLAIDSKESGMCTARFINDSLDKFLWNCEFKIFQGEIWVYTTQDIEPYHELFAPYGWYYWWCRKLTLSKAVWGECARAYHEISSKLNEGHDKLDCRERKLIKSKSRQNSKKIVSLAERNSNHVDMWKSFPTSEGLEVKTRYPRRFKPKMINKSFTNKWQRINIAVRDTYLDI